MYCGRTLHNFQTFLYPPTYETGHLYKVDAAEVLRLSILDSKDVVGFRNIFFCTLRAVHLVSNAADVRAVSSYLITAQDSKTLDRLR